MARFDHTSYALENEAPLWFDGAARGGGGGRNNIYGTAGNDRLHGTAGGDNFHVEQGGDDRLLGGAGDDRFFFGTSYTDRDIVYGGGGIDRLVLDGTANSDITLSASNLRDIEVIKLTHGSYNFTLLDGIGDICISVYNSSSTISVDASDVHSSRVVALGGRSGETLIGGDGDDVLTGLGGPDVMSGGLGEDTFRYLGAIDSTLKFSQQPDIIIDFDSEDRIRLPIHSVDLEKYHVGRTSAHVGDVIASYDVANDQTRLDVFTDSDNVADMTIYLDRDKSDIKIAGRFDVVLI